MQLSESEHAAFSALAAKLTLRKQPELTRLDRAATAERLAVALERTAREVLKR